MPKKRNEETTETEAQQRPAPKRRGPKAGTETAKRGGMAVREKYGQEFFARIGAKGGRTVSERRGSDFYSQIGRAGGQATRDNLGVSHYERIGRMGGLRAKRRGGAPRPDTETPTDEKA